MFWNFDQGSANGARCTSAAAASPATRREGGPRRRTELSPAVGTRSGASAPTISVFPVADRIHGCASGRGAGASEGAWGAEGARMAWGWPGSAEGPRDVSVCGRAARPVGSSGRGQRCRETDFIVIAVCPKGPRRPQGNKDI